MNLQKKWHKKTLLEGRVGFYKRVGLAQSTYNFSQS